MYSCTSRLSVEAWSRQPRPTRRGQTGSCEPAATLRLWRALESVACAPLVRMALPRPVKKTGHVRQAKQQIRIRKSFSFRSMAPQLKSAFLGIQSLCGLCELLGSRLHTLCLSVRRTPNCSACMNALVDRIMTRIGLGAVDFVPVQSSSPRQITEWSRPR
jgi:hypothetical protein